MKTNLINSDDFVKSLNTLFYVIPAKAGIQYFQRLINILDSGACAGADPGFTGETTFYETFNSGISLVRGILVKPNNYIV
jgi:hypothetical protein